MASKIPAVVAKLLLQITNISDTESSKFVTYRNIRKSQVFIIVHSCESPRKVVRIRRRPVYLWYWVALELSVCCLSLRQGRIVIGCLRCGCTSRQKDHDLGKSLHICAVPRHWKVFLGRSLDSSTNVSRAGFFYESRPRNCFRDAKVFTVRLTSRPLLI